MLYLEWLLQNDVVFTLFMDDPTMDGVVWPECMDWLELVSRLR